MREIKFRAKRLDNGEWAYGYGVIIADDFCVLDKRDELYIQRPYTFRNNTHWFELCGIMCDTNTLSQFTGLYTCDRREIFEGDIVKFMAHDGLGNELGHQQGIVKYKFGGYLIGGYDMYDILLNDDEAEIIGNIHDNPELLKTL